MLASLGLGQARADSQTPPVTGSAAPTATSDPTQAPSPVPVPVRPSLKLLAKLAELRQAATALAFAEPERAHSLVLRARLAPWLPEFRMRIDRRFGRTESLDPTTGAPLSDPTSAVGLDTIDDVRYEWRATWDLSRLVFNPDELQAQNEAMRMADVRREVEGAVVKLFFERQRLLEKGRAEATSPAVTLRRAEIEAQLDALTNGLFSRLESSPMDEAKDPR